MRHCLGTQTFAILKGFSRAQAKCSLISEFLNTAPPQTLHCVKSPSSHCGWRPVTLEQLTATVTVQSWLCIQCRSTSQYKYVYRHVCKHVHRHAHRYVSGMCPHSAANLYPWHPEISTRIEKIQYSAINWRNEWYSMALCMAVDPQHGAIEIAALQALKHAQPLHDVMRSGEGGTP